MHLGEGNFSGNIISRVMKIAGVCRWEFLRSKIKLRNLNVKSTKVDPCTEETNITERISVRHILQR